jgi:flagellar hook-basal body complex protein FliE
MAITPIDQIKSMSAISGINPIRDTSTIISQPATGNGQGFKDIFQGLITNVEETEAVTKEDAYKISIGQTDDLHNMMINAAKADIALQTMVQLRNKVLEAYNEIMRINI